MVVRSEWVVSQERDDGKGSKRVKRKENSGINLADTQGKTEWAGITAKISQRERIA